MAGGTDDNERANTEDGSPASGEGGGKKKAFSPAGKTDEATARYVPIGGGSRSRLKTHDKTIPRYQGFVGVDGSQEKGIATMETLYGKLGGSTKISSQDKAWVNKTLTDEEE